MNETPKINGQHEGKKTATWQLPVLFTFGIVFISVLLWLVFSHPLINETQCNVIRIVLALAAAGIGACIPGTISANAPGIAKAGGAAAFFLIVLAVYHCPSATPTSAQTSPTENPKPTEDPKPTEAPADQSKVNPPKFDPIYMAWLGKWEYGSAGQREDGSQYEDKWGLEVVKDPDTEDLWGEIAFSHYDGEGPPAGFCNVSYRLNFAKPYYLEGLNFVGKRDWLQGTCPNPNPEQITGTIVETGEGKMRFSFDYNMNFQTGNIFKKTTGPCKFVNGGFLAQCLPDPSAAYHH